MAQHHADLKTFACGSCQHRTFIDEGRLDYGRATCPHCDHSEPLIHLGRRTVKPPQWRLFAVEALPEPENNRPIPMKQRQFLVSNCIS